MKLDQGIDRDKWNPRVVAFLKFYKTKTSWTWSLSSKIKMNFKFSTKFMKKTPNNTHKTSTVTVKNFTKAVTKIRTYKNSLL